MQPYRGAGMAVIPHQRQQEQKKPLVVRPQTTAQAHQLYQQASGGYRSSNLGNAIAGALNGMGMGMMPGHMGFIEPVHQTTQQQQQHQQHQQQHQMGSPWSAQPQHGFGTLPSRPSMSESNYIALQAAPLPSSNMAYGFHPHPSWTAPVSGFGMGPSSSGQLPFSREYNSYQQQPYEGIPPHRQHMNYSHHSHEYHPFASTSTTTEGYTLSSSYVGPPPGSAFEQTPAYGHDDHRGSKRDSGRGRGNRGGAGGGRGNPRGKSDRGSNTYSRNVTGNRGYSHNSHNEQYVMSPPTQNEGSRGQHPYSTTLNMVGVDGSAVGMRLGQQKYISSMANNGTGRRLKSHSQPRNSDFDEDCGTTELEGMENVSDIHSGVSQGGTFKCQHEDCSFNARSKKQVREHEEDRHLLFAPGREPKPWAGKSVASAGARIEGTNISLDSPEAVAKWIEERKKRWPSAKVVDDKEKQRLERVAAGLEPPGGKGRAERGNKRGRGGDRDRGKGGRDRGGRMGQNRQNNNVDDLGRIDENDERSRKRLKLEPGGAGSLDQKSAAVSPETGTSEDSDEVLSSTDDGVEEQSSKVPVLSLVPIESSQTEEAVHANLKRGGAGIISTLSAPSDSIQTLAYPSQTPPAAKTGPATLPPRRRPGPPVPSSSGQKFNPFARADPFAALAEKDWSRIVSDTLQVVDFLAKNDWLKGVERRIGEIDEEGGVEELTETNNDDSTEAKPEITVQEEFEQMEAATTCQLEADLHLPDSLQGTSDGLVAESCLEDQKAEISCIETQT